MEITPFAGLTRMKFGSEYVGRFATTVFEGP